MKTRALFLFVPVFCFSSALYGQTPDTVMNREKEKQEKKAVQQNGFRDENGNGIDDRTEKRGQGRGSKKDRFVDADGDGICDGRAGGLGFRRGAGGGQGSSTGGKGSGSGNRYGQGGKK
jgi:hypothetical protein